MLTQKMSGKYFLLPNEIFKMDLSSGEISVYAYLMFCENRKTFQCYPSYKTIGKATKMSSNTVAKYVALLEAKSLITTTPTTIITKNGKAQNGSLLYTILPISGAVESYEKRVLKQLKLENDKQIRLAKLEQNAKPCISRKSRRKG